MSAILLRWFLHGYMAGNAGMAARRGGGGGDLLSS